MNKYDHKKIEKKWQQKWAEAGAFKTVDDSTKEKQYVLDMFPYPSGAGLHVGHVEGYTATDIYSRYKRAKGYNVLHPMGWDAFGLPAENYAIKTGTPPRKTTDESIANFKKQISNLGLSYDWGREFGTHNPEYYKWTQWLFTKFFERGLVYKKKALVNWDPVDQTVLANEQVLADGTAERSGAKVEKKELEQWFFKITDYADELIDGLEQVDWPESTKINQRNWIGRSEGAELEFDIVGPTRSNIENEQNFLILHGYTGRSDKNFIPWLKEKLEERGYKVQTPQMPNTDNPTEEDQVAYVLENCQIDENTVLVGHSLGAIVAMKVLLKKQQPIQRLVLIAAARDPQSDTKSKPFHDTFNWDFDFKILKKFAPSRVILSDLKEADRIAYLEKLAKNLDAQLISGESEEEHFTALQEPLILKNLLPSIKVFTTRPDTLFGATYLVLAPEHAFVTELAEKSENKEEIEAYVKTAKNKNDIERSAEGKEKTGVELKGVKAINPANKQEIPIFIADYVLGGYGTGAIMAVPAHDERDFEFAKKFNIPIVEVVSGGDISTGAYTGDGELIHSGEFSGLSNEEAKKRVTEFVGGKLTKTYRLRDWLISRQRYWGAPIPIVYDPEGKAHAVPEEHLPWLLPEDVEYLPKGTSPLGTSKELFARTEKIFGKGWKPEVDTMDTFACSSWYFFRFSDPRNAEAFASPDALKKWLPVDLYVGGAEHTVLHLLYARFFTKALRDMGYLTFGEPFLKLRHQGIILAEDSRKMSKRWGNVINPDDMVERFGADSVRLYEMFMGPLEAMKPWNTNNIMGVRRFLERVWTMQEKVSEVSIDAKTESLLHQTIDKVSKDIEALKLNTAVSSLMILSNHLAELEHIPKAAYGHFLTLLAPFAPHACSELWEQNGFEGGIAAEQWPLFDPTKAAVSTATIAVQINGKPRALIEIPVDMPEQEALEQARANPTVAEWLAKGAEARVVYVPGRIINFVLDPQ